MKIIKYEKKHKPCLLEIGLEWLNKYNVLEDIDIEMLSNPERILEGGGHILLAQTQNGEIAGMVMMENDGDSCEMLKLGVFEKFQGQGAGKALINAVILQAKKDGYKKLSLTSNHQLKAALHLYESAGFVYAPYEKKQFELSDISMFLNL